MMHMRWAGSTDVCPATLCPGVGQTHPQAQGQCWQSQLALPQLVPRYLGGGDRRGVDARQLHGGHLVGGAGPGAAQGAQALGRAPGVHPVRGVALGVRHLLAEQALALRTAKGLWMTRRWLSHMHRMLTGTCG
jgi:hypothetical protein